MNGWNLYRFPVFERVSLGIFIAFIFCVPLCGQETEQEQDSEALPVIADELPQKFEQRLAELWMRYKQAKAEGDEDARDAAFREIDALGRSGQAEIFREGAYLFLNEGIAELEKGNQAEARRDLHNAAALNPYLWPAYEGLAGISDGGGGFARFLRLSIKGLNMAFNAKNAWSFLDMVDWILGNLARLIMLLLIVVVGCLCFKYIHPFYASTLTAMEERHLNDLYAHLLAVTLLALPLLLGLNLYVAAAFYAILFFPFLEGLERTAVTVALVTGVLLAPIHWLQDNVRDARIDPSLRLQLSQFSVGDPQERMAALAADQSDYRSLSQLLRGLLQKNSGEWRTALDTFDGMSASSPWYYHAVINKANIQFMAKEYQDAADNYELASRNGRDEIKAVAKYNHSQVKERQELHEEAQVLRNQALRLEPRLKRRASQLAPGEVLDAFPDNQERLNRALWRAPTDVNRLLNRALPPIALVLVTALGCFIHLRTRNLRLVASSCSKCGRVFFPSDSPESEWCSQCVTLYLKKDDLPSEAKLRKKEEVAAYNTRKRRINTLGQILLPGFKALVRGNPVAGTLTLGVWLMLLVFCLIPVNTIGELSVRFLQSPSLLTWLIGAVAFVYWLIFGLRPIWQEE